MKRCNSCSKYPFCNIEPKDNCSEWIKQKYTQKKLVKVNGLRYEFKEVK